MQRLKNTNNSTQSCNVLLMSKHRKSLQRQCVCCCVWVTQYEWLYCNSVRQAENWVRGMSLSPTNIQGLVYGLWEFSHSASLEGCFAIQMPDSRETAQWKQDKELNHSVEKNTNISIVSENLVILQNHTSIQAIQDTNSFPVFFLQSQAFLYWFTLSCSFSSSLLHYKEIVYGSKRS